MSEVEKALEKALNERIFLILLLKNPKHALSMQAIKVDDKRLEALEKLSRSEMEHWKTVVSQWNGTEATNVSNSCGKVGEVIIENEEQSCTC